MFVRLLLVIALAGLGHAHERATDPGLAAYLGAGGAISEICGDAPAIGLHAECEACRLTGDSGLDAVQIVGLDPSFLLHAGRNLRDQSAERGFGLAAYGPRAPPVVVI